MNLWEAFIGLFSDDNLWLLLVFVATWLATVTGFLWHHDRGCVRRWARQEAREEARDQAIERIEAAVVSIEEHLRTR